MNDVTQFWTIFDSSSVVTLFRNKAIFTEYLTLASSPYDRDVIYVQSQILFFLHTRLQVVSYCAAVNLITALQIGCFIDL